jgi:osmotically-inducible protein OsmY
MHNLRLIALLVVVIPVLSGCVAAVGVGAGTAVLMSEDRRTVGTVAEDQGIEFKAAERIRSKFKDPHINVTSYNRMLLLTGEAPSEALKTGIAQIASDVPNVKSISNEIAIAGPSSLGGRSNDAYLTSKVKARFVDARKFSAQHVKVVTEAGVVFLLGLVTQAEADAAADIARTTGGVQKVVRVFEVISPEQARAIDNPSAKN